MKHTLIAVAAATAALLAGTAQAQSSVQIYGRLNVTAERQDSAGVKKYVLANNASRLGFKGTEDLGGGMKAGFVLEHGFNVDNGSSSQSAFWKRQSEVNLSGGFGMIRLGNFTSEAYYATSDYIGMHNHETGTSSDALYAYLTRDINKVAYRAPEFVKGLTLEVAVLAGEGGGRNRQWEAAANYQLGALHLGFGYEKSGDADQFAASALYEAGAFVFGGMIQRDTDGWGPNLGNRTNYRGSVAYNFGNNELHFNYGRSGEYSKLKGSKASQFTLGYNYNLSKRTKAYTYYTKTSDKKMVYGFGGDFSSIAFGVRHNF
ncbi:MAG: porin [Rubrivivax sp.]|jgi:predicted porin|nr:porin [Rubrivivax sp.]